MSLTEQRNWLIGYDIRNHRRLTRVHRFLKRHAIPVQYSVFVFQGSVIGLKAVLREIEGLIEPAADDVRAYHLPERSEVAMLGIQDLPEGITLPAHGLDCLLRQLPRTDSEPILDYTAAPRPLSSNERLPRMINHNLGNHAGNSLKAARETAANGLERRPDQEGIKT